MMGRLAGFPGGGRQFAQIEVAAGVQRLALQGYGKATLRCRC